MLRPLAPAEDAQEAIAQAELPVLQKLINAQQVNASTLTANGETMLMFAVRHQNAEAVEILAPTLEEDRINDVDDQGNTLLHYAATYLTNQVMQDGRWENSLNDLLNRCSAEVDWDQKNDEGESVLDILTTRQRVRLLEVMEAFVPEEVDSDQSISEHTDSSGEYALEEAVDRFLQRKRR